MQGTPSNPNPSKPGTSIPIRITFEEKEDGEEAEEHQPARTEDKPRRVYIQTWMLDVFGYTEMCPGCDAKRAGLSNPKPNTAQCRERIQTDMDKGEQGKQAKQRADQRWKQWADKKSNNNKQEEEHTKGKRNRKMKKQKNKYIYIYIYIHTYTNENKEKDKEPQNMEQEERRPASSSWEKSKETGRLTHEMGEPAVIRDRGRVTVRKGEPGVKKTNVRKQTDFHTKNQTI